MLPSERHAIILREISKQPAVSIRSLTEVLGVTRETVRKDIDQLSSENKLHKVRGGATRIRNQEPEIETRAATNPEGKSRIAQFVLSQIPDGASLIIDNGSTTLAVARLLRYHRQNLTVYTNDLSISSLLGPVSKEITVLGGRLNVSENATFGIETIEHLSRYRAEFSLIAAGGVSARALLTDFSREAADLRHRMIAQAEQSFILADHSKFGVVGKVVMRPLPDGALVVVDEKPDPETIDAMGRVGMDYQLA
ncbi:DeoR/GlpR family DNA-binding transcription regulator [Rhodobacteraceae bacterium M382]|nr:DeoR/GlpR family DNA-binding transcription regulator [Rhodobacteraceae bacterium M382]